MTQIKVTILKKKTNENQSQYNFVSIIRVFSTSNSDRIHNTLI